MAAIACTGKTEDFVADIEMWELVKAGLGIGVQDGVIGDASRWCVLPDLEPLIFSMWLVTHREVNTSRRIRVVFDLLAVELAKPL